MIPKLGAMDAVRLVICQAFKVFRVLILACEMHPSFLSYGTRSSELVSNEDGAILSR